MDQIVWEVLPFDSAAAQDLAGLLDVSIPTAALLLQRGCHTVEACRHFLAPQLADLTSPSAMQGIKAAADIIRRAVDEQRAIIIYGDYDVDGICSTVILLECLRDLGAKVAYYIPDRLEEGYGLNLDTIKRLATEGCSLLITVDCGISSCEEIALAREMGMEVIVTDHHTPSEHLPRANAIVNPKLDHIEACRELCGAGVAYQLARALLGLADDNTQWLDLVALATIADVVSLTGDNRILVKIGLACLNKTRRLGLSRLMEICGIDLDQAVSPRQVGFMIAPRLNAAGRLSHARLGLELLCTTVQDEAHYLAESLHRLNEERKRTEEIILGEALLKVSHRPELLERGLLTLDGTQWHYGVLGIVASRLSEKYYKPVILINWDDDHTGRGSCRSVEGFDIYAALEACSDRLLRFGGHALAAGLTIEKEQLPQFIEDLERWSQEHYPAEEAVKRQYIDLELDLEQLDCSFWEELQGLGPFGEGNPMPVLAVRAAELQRAGMVGQGKQHFKAQLNGADLDLIAFSKPHYAEFNARQHRADIAFSLDKNEYLGRTSLQLKVKTMKPAYRPDRGPRDLMPWLEAAVSRLQQQEPVLLLAPTYRVLLKMRQSLSLWFCNTALHSLHGHLSPKQRSLVERSGSSGEVALYAVSKAYHHYLSQRRDVVWKNAHIIDLLAGQKETAATMDQHGAKDNIWPECSLQQWHPASLDDIPAQGHQIVYANRVQTIKACQDKGYQVFVEAGLSDEKQRRAIRRGFAQASRGLLLTDGCAISEPLKKVDGVWLADLPFSAAESGQILSELKVGASQAVGCLFNEASLDNNWDYLSRLYPDAKSLKSVFTGLNALKAGGLEGDFPDIRCRLSERMGTDLSPLTLQAALNILVDLGLCQIQKKGSIMAIMLLSSQKKSFDTADSPYYLEGLAAKQAFNGWVKVLEKRQLW